MKDEIRENTEKENNDCLCKLLLGSGEFNPHPSPKCRRHCHTTLFAVRDRFLATRTALTTRSVQGRPSHCLEV